MTPLGLYSGMHGTHDPTTHACQMMCPLPLTTQTRDLTLILVWEAEYLDLVSIFGALLRMGRACVNSFAH